MILRAFRWSGGHLHEFVTSEGNRYGSSDPLDDMPGVINGANVKLSTVLRTATVQYIYDFGDYWEHRIQVEKTHRRTRRRCERQQWEDRACFLQIGQSTSTASREVNRSGGIDFGADGVRWVGGIPPHWRNHRVPTAMETPAAAATSSLASRRTIRLPERPSHCAMQHSRPPRSPPLRAEGSTLLLRLHVHLDLHRGRVATMG